MSKVREQFEEQFYHWCVEDWTRELNSDFHFLRALTSSLDARRAMRVFTSLEAQELNTLTRVLAKRSVSEDVLARCSEPFTEDERELIQTFVTRIRKESWVEAAQTPVSQRQAQTGRYATSKRMFKKHAISELTKLLGGQCDSSTGQEVLFTTPIGPWSLVTSVGFGGRAYSLCYTHHIINNQGSALITDVSLLRWLGISGETQWHDLSGPQCEEVVETLAQLVEHFLGATRELLANLPSD